MGRLNVTLTKGNICDQQVSVDLYHVFLSTDIKRILGECLLISSLPGKALRKHVDIGRLAERFNMRSQSRAW